MARPPRQDPEHGWHHVMNRGINHGVVFVDDADRIEFGARLADIYERLGVQTHAYCLMDNHYHLLLHCPAGGLSVAMQRLGAIYTRHLNDRLGRDGAIFRGRFHSRPVTSDAHLLAACRYIHRNALDLPGVDSVDGYRWSSHRMYLGHRRRPPWLSTEMVLGLAGGPVAFGAMVEADGSPSRGRRWTASEIVGLIDAAALVLAERDACLSGPARSYARSVVLAWAADDPLIDGEVVARALNMSGPGAWRSAVSRARAKTRCDPDLTQLIQRSLDLMGPTPHPLRLGSDPNRDDPNRDRERDQRAARAAS